MATLFIQANTDCMKIYYRSKETKNVHTTVNQLKAKIRSAPQGTNMTVISCRPPLPTGVQRSINTPTAIWGLLHSSPCPHWVLHRYAPCLLCRTAIILQCWMNQDGSTWANSPFSWESIQGYILVNCDGSGFCSRHQPTLRLALMVKWPYDGQR